MSRLRWFLAIAVLAPGPNALRAQLLQPTIIVSILDQKLMLVDDGARAAVYPVSTSKFGLGDNWGSMATPLGTLQVAQKIGDHAPVGAVFHNRRFTGEILQPNTPGRDPIVTRIIWLRGLEAANAHAYSRGIYIHGTPQEKNIGRPASYGCIRMRSSDVTELYAQLPIGAIVQITSDHLPKLSRAAKKHACFCAFVCSGSDARGFHCRFLKARRGESDHYAAHAQDPDRVRQRNPTLRPRCETDGLNRAALRLTNPGAHP